MSIFASNENTKPIATQNFRYDNYCGFQYHLERVDVNGKCGLVCVEELEECGARLQVLLPPVYNDIQIQKISSPKANYDRYAVFADGKRVGNFTMVLNSWVPLRAN